MVTLWLELDLMHWATIVTVPETLFSVTFPEKHFTPDCDPARVVAFENELQ